MESEKSMKEAEQQGIHVENCGKCFEMRLDEMK